MSIERVREYFETLGIADRIKEIDESSGNRRARGKGARLR